MNGSYLGVLACVIPFLVVMAVVIVLSTRSRLRYAARIQENLKNGLYRSENASRRLRTLFVTELASLGLFAVSAVIAWLTQSAVVGALAAVMLVVGVVSSILLTRLMDKPPQ